VDGDVDPVRDLVTIGEELCKKDLQILVKKLDELDKVIARMNDKKG